MGRSFIRRQPFFCFQREHGSCWLAVCSQYAHGNVSHLRAVIMRSPRLVFWRLSCHSFSAIRRYPSRDLPQHRLFLAPRQSFSRPRIRRAFGFASSSLSDHSSLLVGFRTPFTYGTGRSLFTHGSTLGTSVGSKLPSRLSCRFRLRFCHGCSLICVDFE